MSLNDLTAAQRIQNAAKLSAWLYVHEPDLFRQLLVTLPRLQRSPLGKLGLFGDNGDGTDLSTITVSAPDASGDFISSGAGAATDIASDLTSFTPTLTNVTLDSSLGGGPALTDPGIGAAIAAPSVPESSTADSSSSSGGFWSSLGSGLGSAASAVGKVASALVSPQSLQAAGSAASAYFRGQAATAQAQAQQAAVQLQLQRTAMGASPAAVTYVRNPLTGALTPVYQSNTGPVPLTGSLFNQLSMPGVTGNLLPWLLIGGGVLLVALVASR